MGTDAFDGGGGREIPLEAKDRQAVGEGQGGEGEEKDEHGKREEELLFVRDNDVRRLFGEEQPRRLVV